MFTQVPYGYRDGANYKEASTIHLEGVLSPDDIQRIEEKLSGGEFFIPADLMGLDVVELQDRLPSFPCDDDHPWHTLQLYHLTVSSDLPADSLNVIPVEKFVEAFDKIEGQNAWDEVGAMKRLGL